MTSYRPPGWKNYRLDKFERRKVWEYIALTAEGAETTEDMTLAEIEDSISDALSDLGWSWDDAADFAPYASAEFDGKDIPTWAREEANR